ncbi:MAG: imidazolonepropionase [Acidobacteriota bacterium]|nr:imidazolonepropionase [Acidobacteriota bacterium]
MPTIDCLIHDASLVVTCAGPAPRRGDGQRDLRIERSAVIAGSGGRIVFVGPASVCRERFTVAPDTVMIDATGCSVLPGFVDPHTHVVFAGDRRDELRRRLAGATYAEIAVEGGGILSTVRATRAAGEEALVQASRGRLAEMLRNGTTTCEAKSGYGLTLEAELKMLRAVKRLAAMQPVELSPTFLGAHEIPAEFRQDRAAYVRQVIDVMIPAVAREGLAEWCDVFCETGVFTPEESLAILRAGRQAGLRPRIHADELAASGGWRVAAELGARSADHLLFIDREGAAALAAAGVVATLLPIASFYLKLGRFAPARLLIDAGVPVALATDLNPGGGFSASMPFAITLACFAMDMTLEEAIVAATINAAYALDRQDRVGSLEPGKQLDAVLVSSEPIDLIRIGARAVKAVVKNGKVVAGN